MSIERGQGDLLTAQVDALVNRVNTVGVMGKVVLQFKNAFPENFASYEHACKAGEVVTVTAVSGEPLVMVYQSMVLAVVPLTPSCAVMESR